MAERKTVNSIVSSSFIALFVICFFGIIFFSVKNFIEFDKAQILKSFKTIYILRKSVFDLITITPYICGISIVLIFSYYCSYNKMKTKYPSTKYTDMLNGFLILMLLGGLVFFIVEEIALSKLSLKVAEVKAATLFANEYLRKAKNAEENGDLIKALDYYKRYYAYIPKNDAVYDKITVLERRVFGEVNKKQEKKVTVSKLPDSASLFEKAVFHEKRKEYVLALYYIERYLILKTGDTTARELKNRIRENYNSTIETENTENISILQQKTKGMDYINNKKYIDAYLLFENMLKKYPNDKALNEYFIEAKKYYETVDFLLNEAEEKSTLPGTYNVLLKLMDKNKVSYLVWFDKVVYDSASMYVYNMTVYNLRNNQISSYRYGKKIDTYFVVKNTEHNPLHFFFDIEYPMLQQFMVTTDINSFSLLSIPYLLKFIKDIGYNTISFYRYIGHKMTLYLSLLITLILLFKISVRGGIDYKNSGYNIFSLSIFTIAALVTVISIHQLVLFLVGRSFYFFSLFFTSAALMIAFPVFMIVSIIIIVIL